MDLRKHTIRDMLKVGNKYYLLLAGLSNVFVLSEGSDVIENYIKLSDQWLGECPTRLIEHGECIFVLPSKGQTIKRINLNSYEIDELNIPLTTKKKFGESSDYPFFLGYADSNNLYLFGYSFPGILKIDLVTWKAVNIDSWVDNCYEKITYSNDGCLYWKYIKIDQMLYIPCCNMNAVMIFDLQNENVSIVKVGDSDQRYVSIEYDGNNIWLIPRDGRNGSIVRWNIDSNEIRQYSGYPDGYDHSQYAFARSTFADGIVYIYAHLGNMCLCIDTITGEISQMDDLYDTMDVRTCKYVVADRTKDGVLLATPNSYGYWDGNNIDFHPIIFSEHIVGYIDDYYHKYVEKDIREKWLQKVFAHDVNKPINRLEYKNVTLRDYLDYFGLAKDDTKNA